MDKPGVGCQLIIFGRDRIQNDLPGIFKVLSEAGYDGAEMGDLSEQISGPDLSKLLQDNGLKNAGIHSGFDAYKNNTAKMIDYAKGSGGDLLICSGVGDRSAGMAAYEAAAEVFNKVGEECKSAGVTFAYHNHSWEFEKFDGVRGIFRLYEKTDPELVKLCTDTYWIKHGEEDPAEFIGKYLDRIATVHLKDMKATPEMKDGTEYPFAEVGQGILDWKAIMDVLAKGGPRWLTVEQDRTTGDPDESVRISRDYLRENFDI